MGCVCSWSDRNAHNFDALAPYLAAKYHVISVDVRGRGDSQWGPPTEYLPQNYVTDLARRCSNELGIARESDRHFDGRDHLDDVRGRMAGARRAAGAQRYRAGDRSGGIVRESRAYVGGAPERFKDIGEVVKYYKENYPPMAKLADDVVADQVKWSVKPGCRRRASCGRWTPTSGVRCAAAPRSSASICGCRTRESRARR